MFKMTIFENSNCKVERYEKYKNVFFDKHKDVVLKKFKKNCYRNFEREIHILNILSGSKNIVELYACEINVLYLESMDMNLRDLLNKYKNINISHCVKIVNDICNGLIFMKSNNLIHMDIKPENILIKFKGDITTKICDFDKCLSIKEIENEEKNDFYVKDIINNLTTTQISPIERFFDKRLIGFYTDIWGLGCIIYQILLNKTIFKKSQIVDKMEIQKIFGDYQSYNDENDKLPHIIDTDKNYELMSIPENFYKILKRSFIHNLRNRIKIEEILSLLNQISF